MKIVKVAHLQSKFCTKDFFELRLILRKMLRYSGTKIQPKEEVLGRISLRTSGQKLRSDPPNPGKTSIFARTSMRKLRSEKLRAYFLFPRHFPRNVWAFILWVTKTPQNSRQISHQISLRKTPKKFTDELLQGRRGKKLSAGRNPLKKSAHSSRPCSCLPLAPEISQHKKKQINFHLQCYHLQCFSFARSGGSKEGGAILLYFFCGSPGPFFMQHNEPFLTSNLCTPLKATPWSTSC